MTKTKKVIYWIATLWMSLGMMASGIVQILGLDMEKELMDHLGYPMYFIIFIGALKILGVVAVLVPRFPILKEWAYAGFFFTMTGAAFSHIAVGDSVSMAFPAMFLTLLTLVSWYLRPASRKAVAAA